MSKKEETTTSKMVTVVAIKEKKSKLIEGKEYEVTKEVADILVEAKRAKLK